MSSPACSTHAEQPAAFRCDGCARALCPACVREGHRLFFCAHCGERAIAVEAAASSDVVVRRRRDRIERPYSFVDALAYVARGAGVAVLPGYVLVMMVAEIVPLIGPAIAFFVWILVPGLLFEIVRTTASGDDELPDWPDYSELWARIREWFWFVGVFTVTFLPLLFFFRVFDVSAVSFLSGKATGSAWLALAAGVASGLVLGVFAFGSTGAYQSGWLWLRIDLHLRALTSPAWADGLRVAALGTTLFLASQLLARVFAPIPFLGGFLEHLFSGYALFTGAHLVGLIFRRFDRPLDAIYRD